MSVIIVATPKGKLPELNAGVFEHPALRAELARVGVHGLDDLRDTYAMGDAALRAYPALYPSPRHSDYHPILTLRAPVARFQQGYVGDVESIMTAPWPMTRAWGGPEPRVPPAEGAQLNLQVLQRRSTAHLLSQRLQHGADLPGGGDHALADALRALLNLYNLQRTSDHPAGRVNDARIMALQGITESASTRIIAGAPVRGTKLSLTAREDGFVSKGDAFLFSSVLDRIYGRA